MQVAAKNVVVNCAVILHKEEADAGIDQCFSNFSER